MNYARRVFRCCAFLLSIVVIVLQITACRQPSEPVVTAEQQIDKGSLFETLAEARDLHDYLEVSHDGTDVHPDRHWVSHGDKHILWCAIDDAEAIHSLEGATKEQLELALQGLINAMNHIHNEKQNGKKSPSVINKSALADVINEANTKIEGVNKSNNGNDVPDTKYWVNAEAYDALQNAIGAADAVNVKETATQEEVDAAVAALETAISAFAPQLVNVDRTLLNNKIGEARVQRNDVNVNLQTSEDGHDVHKSRYWVTPSAVSEFDGAIAAASSVYLKSDATQNEINAALQNLGNASNKFNNGRQLGRNEVDRLALSNAIKDAESKLADVVIAESGSTVLNSLKWVSREMFDTLETAYEAAVELYDDDHATQEEVDAMAETLANVITGFISQPGLLTSGGISYVFNQPEDENIVLAYTQTLSWVKNDKLQITVTGQYDSYLWTYIDGDNDIKNVNGNSLTVNARDFGTGTYSITLKVTKSGVPYTKTLTFNVE